MPGRMVIRDRRTALLIGLGGLGLAWLGLYQAYDARGSQVPKILRPVTWW